MNDFYSVLTQSIIDRGLRSARDREATYSQARTAMIRRLWSYDPPLAEDEIDARIGQFDLAVDQIESNVLEVFERMPEPEQDVEPPRDEPPPIIDGYDREADYAPAFGPGPAEADAYDGTDGYGYPEEPVRPPPPQNSKERGSLVDLLSTLDIRSMAVEAALNSDPNDFPEPPAEQPPPGSVVEEDEPEEDVRSLLPVPVTEARDIASYSYSYEEEAVLVEPPPRPATRPAPRSRAPAPESRPSPTGPRRQSRPRPQAKRPPRGQPRRKAVTHRRSPSDGQFSRRQLGILIGVVGVLAVALIAVTAYILMPAGTDRPALANAPGTPAAAPPSANGLPPLTNGTIHRFVLFDGSDPTVFDTDPSNPVRFDGETARVATSSASAGARALVGPGLAARLGGHTVNVIVVARSARENGAANLRFALQSGLAVSYWKTASLTQELEPISLTWRVPTLRTDPKGDSIVIEPGIPGDGTGTEISAIVVDVLD